MTFFEVFVILNLLIISFILLLFFWQAHQQRNLIIEHLVEIRHDREYTRRVLDNTYDNGADVFVQICRSPKSAVEEAVELPPTPSRLEVLMDEELPAGDS